MPFTKPVPTHAASTSTFPGLVTAVFATATNEGKDATAKGKLLIAFGQCQDCSRTYVLLESNAKHNAYPIERAVLTSSQALCPLYVT